MQNTWVLNLDFNSTKLWVWLDTCFLCFWASLVAQMVKNLPAMRETWVWSLGWEDPLEKTYPLQYSGLENLLDRGDWQAVVHGVTKSRTWWGNFQSFFWGFPGGSEVKNSPAMEEVWVRFLGLGMSPGGGNDNLLQYSCWGKSHGLMSLAGYSPWGLKRVGNNLVTKQQQSFS